MSSIIRWTLWLRRISTVWWSIGVAGFIFINMIFYPSFKDQAADFQKSFENLPETAVQLFGGSTDFFSPVGFLNSQIFFLMLPLLLGVLAIGLGSSLVAREEQEKTLEVILARPISRARFLGAKALAGLAILTTVTLVGVLTTVILARIVDIKVGIGSILLASLACYILAISFGAVAFMLTTIGRARGASIGIASLFALGGYIISSLAGTVDWLVTPSKAFPFHYYHPEAILRGSFEFRPISFLLAVVAVCVVVSWLSFRRRDIS